MITRGKSCLRRGNLSTFLDNVAVPASNEPLQFLYPPFANTHLTRCQASESRAYFSSTRRPKSRRYHDGLQQQSQSFDHKSRRCLTQESYLSRSDTTEEVGASPSSVISDSDVNRDVVLDRFDDGQRTGRLHANSREPEIDSHSKSELENLPEPKFLNEPASHKNVENADVEYEDVKNEDLDTTDSFTIRTVQSNAPPPEERERRALMRKRDAELARMSAQVNTSALSKKMRYRQFIVSKPGAKVKTPPHWTELMARLERMHNETIVTPTKVLRKEILLREETVAFFSGTTRSMENIWYVRVRNGCKVQVLDSLESEGIYRKVVLSGTKRVIELVEKQFQQYDEQIRRSGSAPVVPSMLALRQQGLTPPLVRRWWCSPNNDNRTTVSEPVPGIVVNSTRRFNRLVEQWVYYEPPVKGYWHTIRVKDELVDLFSKPGNKLYLSSNALHLALTWLTDHEFLDSARKVFEVANVVSTTNTFNVFLRATAKRQDPWYFRHVLMEMEKAGLQPNGHTWMALLRSLVSPGPRRQLMRRMNELGLIKDQRVLHDMIEHDLSLMVSTFLEEGNGIQAFLETLELEYGSDIMTTNLLNGILRAVFLRRDFDLAADILRSYERFGLAPNARTFTAALPIFYRIGPAVEVMTPYLRDHEHLLHHRHYDMLFLDAIASNATNACRVIWRYASMRGETSPTMRYIVLSSLLGKVTGKGAKHAVNPEHIHHHIGGLVIGLNYPQTQPTTKAASLVPLQYQSNPIVYLLRNREKMSASQKNKLVKALMEDDIERGPHYEPLEPFTVMLDAAVRLDSSPEYSWDRPEEGNYAGLKNLPTIEILKHAIDVPVERASTTGK